MPADLSTSRLHCTGLRTTLEYLFCYISSLDPLCTPHLSPSQPHQRYSKRSSHAARSTAASPYPISFHPANQKRQRPRNLL